MKTYNVEVPVVMVVRVGADTPEEAQAKALGFADNLLNRWVLPTRPEGGSAKLSCFRHTSRPCDCPVSPREIPGLPPEIGTESTDSMRARLSKIE